MQNHGNQPISFGLPLDLQLSLSPNIRLAQLLVWSLEYLSLASIGSVNPLTLAATLLVWLVIGALLNHESRLDC